MRKLSDKFCIHKDEKATVKVDEIKTKRPSEKEWTPEDTRRLYPSLTEDEAKKAWEEGW